MNKKTPKKLLLSKETLKNLELAAATGAAGDITEDCRETLKNIVCQTMP